MGQSRMKSPGQLCDWHSALEVPSRTHLRDDVEAVPGLPLDHDFLSIFKLHRLQGIGHSQALPLFQGLCRGQQGVRAGPLATAAALLRMWLRKLPWSAPRCFCAWDLDILLLRGVHGHTAHTPRSARRCRLKTLMANHILSITCRAKLSLS